MTPGEEARAPIVPAALPRLLCVDDDPMYLRALERVLKRDHDVVLVAGADEALRAIEELEPFDVVICDLNMPGLQGAAFIRRIHEIAWYAERLILTGAPDPALIAEATADGSAMRLLLKPCPPATLIAAVADALLRVRARRLRLGGPISGPSEDSGEG